MSNPYKLYVIGSLRNPQIPIVSNLLRAQGIDAFDDWYSAGPEADDKWRDYERARGHSYLEALKGHAARNVFQFDHSHLEQADGAILVLPAGKSGHLELGWAAGRQKWTSILLEPDAASSPEFRYDVMYQFANLVTDNLDEVIQTLRSFTV